MKNNVKKRLVGYSCLIFIVTELLKRLYVDIDLFNANNTDLFVSGVINSMNIMALAVALSCMVVFGIFSIRRKGLSLKSSIIPCMSILIYVIVSILPFSGYTILGKLNNFIKFDYSSDFLAGIEKQLNRNDLSIEQRSFLSRSYAEHKYEAFGIILDYITNENEVKTFKPTISQVNERDDRIKSEAEAILMLNLSKEQVWVNLFFWLSVLFINIMIGISAKLNDIQNMPS
jgi:hypothetical protein